MTNINEKSRNLIVSNYDQGLSTHCYLTYIILHETMIVEVKRGNISNSTKILYKIYI